jgi:peptide/nickel transport system substrate-binding protein
LLRAIQRRTAAAVPYLPVWLMAEQAWSGRRISAPQFDGSGRLRLDQLRRLPGPPATLAPSPGGPEARR